MPFSPSSLYSDSSPCLSELDSPFSEVEIRRAVFGLKNNKSSGPDGFPNEFFKTHWEIIKEDLLGIFEDLFQGTLCLHGSNLAHIILLPKHDTASSLSSFRPISILCYIPKLVSKVLANRLAAYIPDLIANAQTGFVKGRFIGENFNTAREIIAEINRSSEPAFLLKLDFRKAFDSVAWPFLLKLLHARGFPPHFVSWIKLSLSSTTSSVLLNDHKGPVFPHKRGLRQGDLISPYLFISTADVLTRMLHAASSPYSVGLCPKLQCHFYLLQYADDTMLFSIAKGSAPEALRLVLDSFS